MAMIECPECSKEISDKAASCPNCGAPIAGQSKNQVRNVRRTGGWYELVGTISIIAGLIFSIAGSQPFGGLLLVGGFVVFLIGRFF